MAEDGGGVTLKIDADTARYIANIAKAAEHTKKLGDHVKETHGPLEEMTEFAQEAGSKMLGWGGPITLATAGISVLEKGMELFHERVVSAGEALNKIRDLNQAIIGAGLGNQTSEVREAIEGNAPSMSLQQKTQFFSAYIRSNAGASVEDIGGAAAQAEKASYLGRDQGQFGGLLGDLNRVGVKNSGDVADYLLKRAPDLADRASAAIAKAPDQADDIAQLAATAGRGGKHEKQFFEKVISAFLEHGGQGKVGDYMNARTAGRAGLGELAFFQNPRNQAPAIEAGEFDRDAELALGNTEVGQDILARRAHEAAEGENYASTGGKARRKKLADAAEELQDSQGSIWQAIVRDSRGAIPFYAADKYDPTLGGEKSSGYLHHAASEAELGQYLRELIAVTKANGEKPPLRPKSGQHGEHTP